VRALASVDPNGVRFDAGRPGGHVESYFLKINDPARPRALWVKSTILAAPGRPPVAEAWAIAFDRERGHVALKTEVPYDAARFGGPGPLDVEVAGCTMTDARVRGELARGGQRIAWDLAIESLAPTLYLLPDARMYTGPFPSSKSLSPKPDLRAKGSVEVDRERWEVDLWPGLLGHNWGKRHAPLYAWGHASTWDEAPARPGEPSELVFEGVSARVAVGPLSLPPLTVLCFRFRGVRYELSRPTDLVRTTARIAPRQWTFSGKNDIVSVEGELWADTADFVGLRYRNPRGPETHCLNTKLARARLEISFSGRAPRVFRSSAAALEIGTHDVRHGIRMMA
jgi:hypothetical protein